MSLRNYKKASISPSPSRSSLCLSTSLALSLHLSLSISFSLSISLSLSLVSLSRFTLSLSLYVSLCLSISISLSISLSLCLCLSISLSSLYISLIRYLTPRPKSLCISLEVGVVIFRFKVVLCEPVQELVLILDKNNTNIITYIRPSTRNTQHYILPYARTLVFQTSFFPSTIKIWNNLQPVITNSTTIPRLRKALQSTPTSGRRGATLSA